MEQAYWLLNVRLEDGYEYTEGTVTKTITNLYNVLIKNDKISEIIKADEPIKDEYKQINVAMLLALPPFAEKHYHLDKSYYGGEWKSAKPVKNLLERLEDEASILPHQIGAVKSTARLLINKIMEAGSTHIRTHVNIDPYVGLKNLEMVRDVLEEYQDRLTYEIVAFPQHGLLRTNVSGLMQEAMTLGATHVGGLDPAGVDRNMERSLAEMMDIAVKSDADIDIHLHDPDYLGAYTINKLLNLTEDAGWQNRVAVSHGFGLGGVTLPEAESIADRMAANGVSLISTVPIKASRTIPPLQALRARGVHVALGCDSMFDWWGPFGNANIVDRLSQYAEYSNWCDERTLAESLGFITGGITPLNADGKKVWPQIGDEASFVLAEASCSAELIARRSRIHGVVHKGKLQVKEGISHDYNLETSQNG